MTGSETQLNLWYSPRFFLLRFLPAMMAVIALCILYIDYPLADWVKATIDDRGKGMLRIFGYPGRGDPWIAVILAMLLAPWASLKILKRKLQNPSFWQMGGFFASLVMLSSTLIVTFMKYVIGRPRPHFSFQIGSTLLSPLTDNPKYASFPSGHSQTAWAGALALGLLFPRLRLPLITIAILTCLNRIGTNRHYLSDTLAGFAVAFGCTVIFYRLFKARNIFRALP